jgi:hypothetical protein
MGDGRGYADHGWNRTADSGLADSGLGALLMHHQPVTRSPGPASARVARRSALCIGSGGPIPPRPLGAQGRRRLAGTAASRPAASVYAGTGSVRWPGGRRSRPCQIVNGVPSLPAGVRFAESCPPSPLRQPTMQGQEWGTQFLAAPNRIDGAVPLGVKPRPDDPIRSADRGRAPFCSNPTAHLTGVERNSPCLCVLPSGSHHCCSSSS